MDKNREDLLRAAQEAFAKNDGKYSSEIGQLMDNLGDTLTPDERLDGHYTTDERQGRGIEIRHRDDPFK